MACVETLKSASQEYQVLIGHPWWRASIVEQAQLCCQGLLPGCSFWNRVTFVDLLWHLWNVKGDSMVYTWKPRLSIMLFWPLPHAPWLPPKRAVIPGTSPPQIPACAPHFCGVVFHWESLLTSISHQCFLILTCAFLQCLWTILICSVTLLTSISFFSPTSFFIIYLPIILHVFLIL